MKRMQREGGGVVVYVQRERRGTSLLDEVKAHCRQDERSETVEVENRRVGAQILKELGLKRIRFVSDCGSDEAIELRGSGPEVTERLPH